MSFQPAFGQLCTLFPIKIVYLSSILVFEVGSIISASAPTAEAFIVGRLVSGAAAGGLWCGTLTLMAHAVSPSKRHLYVSVVTSMYGVASVAGPLLGGIFTDSPRLTWRFCFWVNLRELFESASPTETLTDRSCWLSCLPPHRTLPQTSKASVIRESIDAEGKNSQDRYLWRFPAYWGLRMPTASASVGRNYFPLVASACMGLPPGICTEHMRVCVAAV